jgi:hypothetical protein
MSFQAYLDNIEDKTGESDTLWLDGKNNRPES